MPFLGHLSELEIRRCVAGSVGLEAERHLCFCSWCMERLAEAGRHRFCWERRGLLGRLVRIDPAQEIDELLAQIEEERRFDAA
jgi:hypothetical protein